MGNKIIDELIMLCDKAYKKNEVPVSAIIVQNGKIIAKTYNKKELEHDVTAHAEIIAIKKASKKLKRWNLNDCELYVSLKPCNMCAEVIKESRIDKVYYLLDKLDYKKGYSKTQFTEICDEKYVEYKKMYKEKISDFFKNKGHR